MNRQTVAQLSKRVDKLQRIKNFVIWPIMGGNLMVTETNPAVKATREVTLEEQEILQKKSLPAPIAISLEREKEFQEYLKA